ncbi:glycosyltransferase [Paludisphaera rhizosphaerae]|uniref:glycosyltransferase n=1 Tax=Paludisphaera rhizosphaerae TaxID=2711216 RepID=UPI0013ECBDDD|nr:glycosyltransferase [Paludisphaera rhizosphaerae]
MSQDRSADVIVPVTLGGPAMLGRLCAILECSGPALGRLLVVDDGCGDRVLAPGLAELAEADGRLQIVRCPRGLTWADYANRGLTERRGDVVLLAPDARPLQHWIEPLAEAAHSEERVALASPLTNGDGLAFDEAVDEARLRKVASGMPEFLPVARSGLTANFLRGDVLDAVGLLDASIASPRAALDDWLMRACALGFFAKRASRSLVLRDVPTRDRDESADEASMDEVSLLDRHVYLKDQVQRHSGSLDASVAAHAAVVESSGRINVAVDLRHLPLEMNGTKMYAWSLVRALAARSDVDLTLLAVHPLQADGLEGRLVSPDEWADDVAIIHKPAQIFDRTHAKLLVESRAHVVLTYQDMIAYRMAHVFENEAAHNEYRQTSRLTLLAVQAILTYSENTAREVEAEFGVDRELIHPIFLGVDIDDFSTPATEAETVETLTNVGLPGRFFLCLASDYPHKNITGLLDAYALLRRWWTDGEPPALALVGRASRVVAAAEDRFGGPIPGVHVLGPVGHDELRVLYQEADALVFPSLYEGFGLPPLEAMAAGTPVIAMPFSSVPEVCGDAVLYCGGLSPVDLARAMQRLAVDDELRRHLRTEGRRRSRELSWEKTAVQTVEVYRKVLLNPSSRSLLARRSLSEAIAHWSQPYVPPAAAAAVQPSEAPEDTAEIEVAEEIVSDENLQPCEDMLDLEPSSQIEVDPAADPEAGSACEDEVDPAPIHEEEPETATALPVAVEPEPVTVSSTVMVVSEAPAPYFEPEPLGIVNACQALKSAVRRRIRRDLVRFAGRQRSRLGRAKRLTIRFIQVVRTDGLSAAAGKAARKVRNKARHVSRRFAPTRLRAEAGCPYFQPPTMLEPYEAWRRTNGHSDFRAERLREQVAQIGRPVKFSILVPVYNTPAHFLAAAVESVLAQTYQHWELILADDASTDAATLGYLAGGLPRDPRVILVRRPVNGNISAATNTAAEHATGDFVVLLDHDDVLDPEALSHFALRIDREPEVDLLYSDEDKLGVDGVRFAPQFKPDWSPELLLNFCYTGHLTAVRASVYREVGGMRLGFEGSQDFDFWLRASERARKIVHVPQVLYHWRVLPGSTAASGHEKPHSFEAGRRAVEEAFARRGAACRVEQPGWALAAGCGIFQPVMPDDGPSVAIVIPTRNQKRLLQNLLKSLLKTTYHNYRVYIIDNDSDDPETLAFLAKVPHQVLHIPNLDGKFNYAAVHNTAVGRIEEDLILFMNNDIEVVEPRWLSQMVGWSRLPGIGAVGARLMYADRRIQHAGVTHGVHEGMAGHTFKLLPWWDGGEMGLARATRDCLAVTAACMLTPRRLFQAMNGFDEVDFGVAFNDADYGYRLHDAGYRSVVCAEAELFHHEGATRGFADDPREEANYRRIHGRRRDPYVSPHYDPMVEAFTIKPTVVPVADADRPVRAMAFSHNLNWEGASRFELELTIGLKQAGAIDPVVVSPVDGPLRYEYEKAGVPLIVDPSLVSIFGGQAAYEDSRRRTIDLLAREGCRVVHANTLHGFWAVDAAREAGLPSIWSIHESEAWQTYFDQFPREIATTALGCMESPYRVVFTAKSSAEVWKELDTRRNFGLVRYALNIERFHAELDGHPRDEARAELGLADDDVCFLLLGTVCDRKGQHDLVHAFRALSADAATKVRCVVVGARDSLEYSRELKRLAGMLPEDRRSRFQIVDETGATAVYWQAADVFCCTSRVESYPHVILEALGRGLPIITTPVFGIPEQVRPNVNGLFYEPGDFRLFARHLEALAREPVRRRAMASASSWILRALPSHSDMIEQYSGLFRAAAESAPDRRLVAAAPSGPTTLGSRIFHGPHDRAKQGHAVGARYRRSIALEG